MIGEFRPEAYGPPQPSGGLFTSFLLELTVYPAIFALWKQRSLPAPRELPASAEIYTVPRRAARPIPPRPPRAPLVR